MNFTKLTAIGACAVLSGSALGGVISEDESGPGGNNSLLTANDIGVFSSPGGSMVIDGFLSTDDVDWFSFTLADTATLSFVAAFGGPGDGVMQIVAAIGSDVIAFDDDSSVGYMPAIQIDNLSAGTYYIGFSGFGDVLASSVASDELADGVGHNQSFAYKLSVGFTIVPAPGALALLGMGGLVATRRRR